MESETANAEQIIDGCLAEIDEKVRMLQESIEMEKRAGYKKGEGGVFNYFSTFYNPHQEMYFPRLPKEIPALNITIRVPKTLDYDIIRVLNKIEVSSLAQTSQ